MWVIRRVWRRCGEGVGMESDGEETVNVAGCEQVVRRGHVSKVNQNKTQQKKKHGHGQEQCKN